MKVLLMEDYKICSRCIMDTTDPQITFNEIGECNHCQRYEMLAASRLFSDEVRNNALHDLLTEIKKTGNGKKYDCIIGVSGGVDSTYIAYLVKEWGLRPLAIHLDNGWNSELAVSNIEKTLNRMEIDLFTYVIDWEEFRDLQLSFLKASTPDAEVPTDHAILALLYQMAAKYGVKHILLGTNVATEAIMPLKWGYGYHDYKYIKNIQKKFGSKTLKSYPHFNLLQLFNHMVFRKTKIVSILNYIDYQKEDAMRLIEDKLGWVYYGGKHYESIYTRFFQAYILPKKFNIDKRRAHNSTLVLSKQMPRDVAFQAMAAPTYSDPLLEAEDKEYFIKKLQLTDESFEDIMQSKLLDFENYKTHYNLLEKIKKIKKKILG